MLESHVPSLQRIHQGKVRDIYAVDAQHMLIVTTDRLSAFDVVMPDPIPGKGRVLTQISNFWFQRTRHIVPNHLADFPLALYAFAVEHALERGIIIADTKFEFGVDEAGRLTLIDEALTPDSSRFWPADTYRPGTSPPSFDKQYVRDYLETLDWPKRPPGPKLPPEIVARTSEKYAEALRRLTS
jgi:phosphoribosylaminoimidazole-succinocarboxamide synthase